MAGGGWISDLQHIAVTCFNVSSTLRCAFFIWTVNQYILIYGWNFLVLFSSIVGAHLRTGNVFILTVPYAPYPVDDQWIAEAGGEKT